METQRRLISNVTARHLLKILQENVTQRPHLLKLPGLWAEGPTVTKMWGPQVASLPFMLTQVGFIFAFSSCNWGPLGIFPINPLPVWFLQVGFFWMARKAAEGKLCKGWVLKDGISLFPTEVWAPSPNYLLEQAPKSGDTGLIQAFKISSQWTRYRQAFPKSQECLRWLRKVKSWGVQGFF